MKMGVFQESLTQKRGSLPRHIPTLKLNGRIPPPPGTFPLYTTLSADIVLLNDRPNAELENRSQKLSETNSKLSRKLYWTPQFLNPEHAPVCGCEDVLLVKE